MLRILPEKLANIYLKRPTVWLYLLFGALAMMISIGVQYIMKYALDTPVYVNTAVSWLCAATFAFFMNKYEIFDNREPGAFMQFAKFMGSRLGVLAIETAFMTVTVDILSASEYIMKLIAQVFVTILNYIFGRLVLSKRNKDKEPRR